MLGGSLEQNPLNTAGMVPMKGSTTENSDSPAFTNSWIILPLEKVRTASSPGLGPLDPPPQMAVTRLLLEWSYL